MHMAQCPTAHEHEGDGVKLCIYIYIDIPAVHLSQTAQDLQQMPVVF